MKKLQLLIYALAILLVMVGVFVVSRNDEDDRPEDSTATTTPSGEVRVMPIEDYIRLNISGLSAEVGKPEVLGGKYYVTSIEAGGGEGVVSYEDGHNAYTADFTYEFGRGGVINVKTFEIR